MAKASINFKEVKSNSESHNQRTTNLDYVYDDLTPNNESWQSNTIEEKRKEIEDHCKKVSGRRMYKSAKPIREAVVNLNANHKMNNLKELANKLEEKKGIKCFQIHIHNDEGKSKDKLNHHAHMVFDWQNKKTGKMINLNRKDLSEIQTTVAEQLNMERGELKENTNRERLEAVEYKTQQEERKLLELNEKKKTSNKDILTLKENTEKLEKNTKELKEKIKTESKSSLKGYLVRAMEKIGSKKMKKQQIKQLLDLKKKFKDLKKNIKMSITNTRKLLQNIGSQKTFEVEKKHEKKAEKQGEKVHDSSQERKREGFER